MSLGLRQAESGDPPPGEALPERSAAASLQANALPVAASWRDGQRFKPLGGSIWSFQFNSSCLGG